MPAFETVRLQSIATVLMASERMQQPMTVEQRSNLIVALSLTCDTIRSAAGEAACADADAILVNPDDGSQPDIVTLEGHPAPRAFETVALSLARETPGTHAIVLLSRLIDAIKKESVTE